MRDFPQSLLHGSQVHVDLDPSRILLVFSHPPVRRELWRNTTSCWRERNRVRPTFSAR
jgi:hypothetical protein